MGVAAALIVMIAVFWMGNYSTTGTLPGSSEEGIETFTTEKGERATVRLSDGTHVRLNVNSRLTVSNSFGDERRRVRLDGEAYFDVATDSTKPFMVHAGGTVTRVLGTAFDVSAYPDEEEAKVIVTEGRVSLQADSGQIGENEDNASREKESVILTERQMARVLNSGGQIIRQKTEGQQHLAWMNGELILNDAPFSKVVRSLERWYDLEIILEEGATPPIGHLNARFAKEQALEEVLTVVATAFRLEYKRHRKRVIFSPSK